RPSLDMGYQTDRNLALAAHPTQRDTVLAAGRRNGVLGSTDGAKTWDAARWPSKGMDFPGDVLCVLFGPGDPPGNTLWAGSDGGAFRSADVGVNWDSTGNAGFPTLMFDAHGTSAAPSLSANPANPDVLVGGLQDNGLVYCGGVDKPWVSIIGGDGFR